MRKGEWQEVEQKGGCKEKIQKEERNKKVLECC